MRRPVVLVLVVATLGFGIGSLYAVNHRPEPRASVDLYVPSGSAWTAQTQASLLYSDVVLAAAAQETLPPLTIDQLAHLISGSALGPDILRIEARAPSTDQALQLTNAVSNQYAQYIGKYGEHAFVLESASVINPPSTIVLAAKDGLLGLVVGSVGLMLATIVVLVRRRRRWQWATMITPESLSLPVSAPASSPLVGVRKPIIIAVLGLGGLFGGIFYAHSHSRLPLAVASIVLPTPATAADRTPSTATETATYIAQSPAVLASAGQSVTPPLPLDQVEHLVRATTLGHLVRIDARAPQSSQALQLANAVANGYVQASAEYGLGAAVVLSTSALVPNAQSGKSLMLHGLIGLMVGLLVGAAVVLVMGRRWLRATASTIGD